MGCMLCARARMFRLERGPETARLPRALNSVLPAAIRVWHAAEVSQDFHARFSAIGKRYAFRIMLGGTPDPIVGRYSHYCGFPLDIGAMRRGASLLIGTHDFLAFSANPGVERVRPTVRTLRSLHVLQHRHGLSIVVQGDGFLYNMVRILAGSLLEVGRGKCEPDWLSEVLDSRDRKEAGPTLPAKGLFLIRALYPADLRPLSLAGGGKPAIPSDLCQPQSLAGWGDQHILSSLAGGYTLSSVRQSVHQESQARVPGPTASTKRYERRSNLDIELSVRAGHVSDRVRDYAKEKIGKVKSRFDRVGTVHVTLDSHKEDDKHVHVHAHLDTGAILVAEARAPDIRGAIDEVSDNLLRQVRREKERLIDRNRRVGHEEPPNGPSRDEGPASEPSYEDVIREDLDK